MSLAAPPHPPPPAGDLDGCYRRNKWDTDKLMWTDVEALFCAKCFLQFYGCHVPRCVHRTRAAGVLNFAPAACSVNAHRRDETRRQPTELTRKYPQPSTRKPQHGAFYQSFLSFPRGGTPPPPHP